MYQLGQFEFVGWSEKTDTSEHLNRIRYNVEVGNTTTGIYDQLR